MQMAGCAGCDASEQLMALAHVMMTHSMMATSVATSLAKLLCDLMPHYDYEKTPSEQRCLQLPAPASGAPACQLLWAACRGFEGVGGKSAAVTDTGGQPAIFLSMLSWQLA